MAARTSKGGKLIVIDGIDGSGKTTQLKAAERELKKLGWQVEAFRYLGGSPIGEKLRQVMFSPLSRPPEVDVYISLAVQYALAAEIEAARSRGSLILLDRGPLSLLAYEFYGPKFNLAKSLDYLKQADDHFKADLTIVLKCDLMLALKRSKREASGDYFGNQPIAYFKRVEKGYRDGLNHISGRRAVIDASGPIAQINQAILAEIKATL